MASLATIVRGFVGVREELELMNVAVRPRTESCRLRPLANEDVYLYVKRIDNTAVVRASGFRERHGTLPLSFGFQRDGELWHGVHAAPPVPTNAPGRAHEQHRRATRGVCLG